MLMQGGDSEYFATGDPWKRDKLRTADVVERVEKRLLDLGELRGAVQDRLEVLNVREGETTRRLHVEADQLLRCIRQREEELVSMVRDDCRLHRAQLEQVLERIGEMERQLAHQKGRVKECGHDALQCEGVRRHMVDILRDCAFFYVPDPHCYVVTTQAIHAERHMTLVKEPAPSFLPSALTVPITGDAVHLPLHVSDKSFNGNAAPSSVLQNGVFHYIATAGGTKPFYNPVESDALRVWCSAPVVLGSLSALFENVDAAKISRNETEAAAVLQQYCIRTVSQEMARIEIDFGDRRWVECTAYALRHGHTSEHAALRSWRLLASRDKVHWVELDEQQRNGVLGSASFNVATFSVDERRVMSRARSLGWTSSPSSRCAFRYIMLELIGPDAVGEHHLELSGLELYGYLVSTILSP